MIQLSCRWFVVACAVAGVASMVACEGGEQQGEQEAKQENTEEGWPTEEEAKAAIFKLEYGIHASDTNKDVWHVKDMRHEVHSVKFAERTTQKQMNYGAQAITVYPAKILYTRITEYTDKPEERVEEGADGVWFFYKDSFGDWQCKYGNE